VAAREKFRTSIECPKCKQQGILHHSEDDHAYIKNVHRELDRVEGGFKAEMHGKLETKVICQKCSQQFIV